MSARLARRQERLTPLLAFKSKNGTRRGLTFSGGGLSDDLRNSSLHMAMTTEASTQTADETDPRKVDTAKRILDEAERLFRHYGYSKTTVADIARELGMSPANIYRFYAS